MQTVDDAASLPSSADLDAVAEEQKAADATAAPSETPPAPAVSAVDQFRAGLPICPHCGADPCETKMNPCFQPPNFVLGIVNCAQCRRILGVVPLGQGMIQQPKPTGRVWTPS